MANISIKLKPGAKKDTIDIKDDRTVAISVTSRPVEGKANEHLIKLLSTILHVSKSSCTILHGSKSRNKVVAIEGFDRKRIFDSIRQNVKVRI